MIDLIYSKHTDGGKNIKWIAKHEFGNEMTKEQLMKCKDWIKGNYAQVCVKDESREILKNENLLMDRNTNNYHKDSDSEELSGLSSSDDYRELDKAL